ncbi:MAG: heparinase II/III family protein [Gemmobacter sp.]
MANASSGQGLAGRVVQAMNRLAVRRAARAAPAKGFVQQPEPRTIGLFARGRQVMSGHFLMAGRLIEAPGQSLWTMAPRDAAFAAEAHGFAWLDDLAAVGDHAARARAQDWTWDWIARYGRGQGAGWTPDVTGRRLIRWINHAIFLLNGRTPQQSQAFFAALSVQVEFAARRWPAARPGLPRFEALTGLIYAGLALKGLNHHAGAAITALAADCATGIDAQGGIRTRNPEELLEVLTLLTWAAQALTEAGRALPEPHAAAIARIAPCLRSLRHADGGLARFHGGGRGMEGRLDLALAASGVRAAAGPGPAMGYLRLAAGRTTVIVDAADPPGGPAGTMAHASTLAFELTSGRRPMIVSCGSGVPFGPVWARAGRATVSHSVLALEGYSSSRLGRGQADALVERAHVVMARPDGPGGYVLAHDGWLRTHGLTQTRALALSADGRRLTGEDRLAAETEEGAQMLARVIARRRGEPLQFHLRFHLHPDVEAGLDLGGTAVSLVLRSGEVWVFRLADASELGIEASVYLENGRLKPRSAQQIVVSGRLTGTEARIGWTLAKAQDTPLAIRDLDRGDPAAPA